jgi:NitT/TauT family transport system substrate-binding protein
MRTILRVTALVVTATLAAGLVAACTPKATTTPAAQTTPTPAPKPLAPANLRIGTLPTEDTLPLWVAGQKGLFRKAGLTVTIVPFQSAEERDTAFTAGTIDGFMGDIIATAELGSGGFPVRIITIMLGATPAEGRFGIVSSPKSSARTLKEVAQGPIATSSGTIQEYVLDGLMRQAGIAADQIDKQELKKVPLRYQLLIGDSIPAAAMPEPFLTLAIKNGAHLIADDTKGENLSQTVLVMGDSYLQKPRGALTAKMLLDVWNKSVALVNANPNAYRPLLVEKAALPAELASDYRVNKYPKHQLPTADQVNAVLEWMRAKGLLSGDLNYDQMVWEPTATIAPSGAASGTPGK